MQVTDKPIQTNPMARGPRAAYIHIPFCRKKCGYCDFYSFVASPQQIDLYVAALINEIKHMSALNHLFLQRERLNSVYFGGGTPSLLEAEHVQNILLALDRHFGLSDTCEVSLEANPDSAEADKFLAYRAAGVNRLSLGVQSLHDSLLKRLERLHDARTAQAAIQKARRSGFLNLSIDLMLGLPGQTMDDLANDLEILLKEDIPHFSLYSLGIEEDTLFYARYFQEAQSGESVLASTKIKQDPLYAPLPSPEAERAMYHFCREYMHEEGYRHYEVSNFAKPGYESKHNQVYWRAEPYWGFGVAAAAYVAGRRCTQTRDFDKYLKFFLPMPQSVKPFETGAVWQLEDFNPCLEECIAIDRTEAMREFFLLGLRLREGLSLQAFKQRFGEDLPDDLYGKLFDLTKRKLLLLEEKPELQDKSWKLSLKGLDFGNEVFQEFV